MRKRSNRKKRATGNGVSFECGDPMGGRRERAQQEEFSHFFHSVKLALQESKAKLQGTGSHFKLMPEAIK